MNQRSDHGNIVDVGLDTFEEVVLHGSSAAAVLVDFWAAWCGPCRTVSPVLEKLAAEYGGRMVLAKVDCDREQELARQWHVRGLPTLAIFRHGEMVEQLVGAQPEGIVRAALEPHLPGAAAGVAEEAAALAEAGDAAQAVEMLRGALAGGTDSTSLRLTLAALLTAAGSEDEASEVLDGVRTEDQATPEYRAERTRVAFAKIARDAPSRADLERRIEADPGDCEARYLLAARHVVTGAMEPAMAQLLEIVRLDRSWRDDAGRRALVDLFHLLPRQEPLVSRYRGRLAQLMH